MEDPTWAVKAAHTIEHETMMTLFCRTEYIGGDSRYWPPSSWIMHLVGPEGFDHRPDLCDQYQPGAQ